MLTIIFAVKIFPKMVHGEKFILRTDHRPLLNIFGSQESIPTPAAHRLQRWGMVLLNYDLNWRIYHEINWEL